MKAVVWTDVFQLIFMFLSVLIMLLLSTSEAGGPAAVWDRNYQADWSTRIPRSFLKFRILCRRQLSFAIMTQLKAPKAPS